MVNSKMNYSFTGYRIFQSVGDAYSLKAWLATDEKEIQQDDLWTNGHIRYWRKNYNRLETHIQNIKTKPLKVQPFLTFVKVSFV